MLKNKSNTICIIPARKNSKRIKNKNLLKIKGKTLIEISINLAKRSGIFKDIILSSDSEKILSIGKKNKITILRRTHMASRDNSPTEAVLREIIGHIKYDFDNIIILQVTSPLRKTDTLIKFFKFCLHNKISKCLSVSKLTENISNIGKYFRPFGKNLRRSQLRKSFIYENGLLYFVTKKAFLKDGKIYSNKNWRYFTTDKYESIDINEYQDFLISKKIY